MTEELIDVITEEGALTGESKNKNEIHTKGYWHRTAHIWIVNSKGELIIQKRSPNKINFPDLWDISAAGHISAGQTSLDAAQRETEEELGLRLPIEKFELIATIKRPQILNNGTYIDNEITDIYLVVFDFNLAELKAQQDEVADIKTMPWRELQALIASGGQGFVPHNQSYPILFAELKKRFG